MMMRCILADDEPLARKGIENFIKEVPFLQLVDSCTNALQLIDYLSKEKVDLLFLDIQMPKMTGIDFLRNMKNPPITIITTAFPNYAIESFELDVIDYLIKPIPFERFLKAVHKAKDYFELQQSAQSGKTLISDFFFLKCDNRYEKILYNDVLYVEALQNYVVIHTEAQKFISYLTLKIVEDKLAKTEFVKINKSYIVSLSKIERIEGNELTVGNHKLPIGRTYKDEVMQTILNERLLKR